MQAASRILAIECATEACSVALFENGALLANDHQVLGRGHAEHLVPMIAALPDKGRADTIMVSLGPGSFTGVRIGIAVATSLAIAWGSEVRGYPTLALVAAMAIADRPADSVTVAMAGGHGEWFVQDFAAGGLSSGPLASLTPAAASARGARRAIAGTRAAELAALLGGEHEGIPLLPDASRISLLQDSPPTAAISPIYGRGPDARLPA